MAITYNGNIAQNKKPQQVAETNGNWNFLSNMKKSVEQKQ